MLSHNCGFCIHIQYQYMCVQSNFELLLKFCPFLTDKQLRTNSLYFVTYARFYPKHKVLSAGGNLREYRMQTSLLQFANTSPLDSQL